MNHDMVECASDRAPGGGASISAEFDFRQTGRQSWDIGIEASGDRLCLGRGNSLSVAAASGDHDIDREYQAMYRHILSLVSEGQSLVNVSPLTLVADAFLKGR